MKEVTLEPINKAVKNLLDKMEKDMNVAEHQTGPFGQVHTKLKKKKTYLPKGVDEEQRMNKTMRMIVALQKMDVVDAEVQGGFGTSDPVTDEEKADNENLPKTIQGEKKGFTQKAPKQEVEKASYEYVASDSSYTDESNPADDVFYMPKNIDFESGDTDKDSEEKEKKRKHLEETTFGNIEENVSDQGKARSKQNYNAGTVENAQIGNQGV